MFMRYSSGSTLVDGKRLHRRRTRTKNPETNTVKDHDLTREGTVERTSRRTFRVDLQSRGRRLELFHCIISTDIYL